MPLWKVAVARAGLSPDLRFHGLRHTCASLLIAMNVIQEQLGHSAYKITMDTYGHLRANATGRGHLGDGRAVRRLATYTVDAV